MKRKHQIASILLYNFIALTVAIGGWLWEVLIFIVKERHFVNRGFLYGPYLPVYGFGAVILSILFYQKRISVIITYAHLQTADYPHDFYHSALYARLKSLINKTHCRRRLLSEPVITRQTRAFFNDMRIFLLSMCGGCLTEFGAGWLLWHILHRKYWDYSGYPMNLGGYVCLYSALGFGIFGILWMKWAGPFLIRTWERLRFSVQIPIIGLLDLMLITDVIFSIMQPNSGRNITF